MTKSLEALMAKMLEQTKSFDTVHISEVEARQLIAALEQSQQREKDLCVGVDVHRARIAYLEKTFRETEETLIAAGDQIAELEALCVKSTDAMREVAPLCVKLPNRWHARYNTIAGGFNEKRYDQDVIAAIRAAGGSVEGSD